MTIRKITAGDGYLYLIRQVAHGDTDPGAHHDAASYYTAEGNPPGRWTGRGAPLLGLDGKQVTEEQMRALFGYGQHPDAEAIIASEVERFEARQHTLDVVPTIVSLQDHLETIRQAEIDRVRGRLGPLSPEQEIAVEALTRGIINKVMHTPITTLKTAAREAEAA